MVKKQLTFKIKLICGKNYFIIKYIIQLVSILSGLKLFTTA